MQKNKFILSFSLISFCFALANCATKTKVYQPAELNNAVNQTISLCISKSIVKAKCSEKQSFQKTACENAAKQSCRELVEKGTEKKKKKIGGNEAVDTMSLDATKLRAIIAEVNNIK